MRSRSGTWFARVWSRVETRKYTAARSFISSSLRKEGRHLARFVSLADPVHERGVDALAVGENEVREELPLYGRHAEGAELELRLHHQNQRAPTLAHALLVLAFRSTAIAHADPFLFRR